MSRGVIFGIAIGVLILAVGGAVAVTGVADVDDDGVPPIQELSAGTDPLAVDTDGDDLDDGTELRGTTDPVVADTDDDGIDDGAEAEGDTDPTGSDTDGDRLDDGKEGELGTDPTRADTDGDGLDDWREADLGTDPTAADTDDDGVADARELEQDTIPTDADTDGDGLTDGVEERYVSLPTRADTDGDGLDDAQEVEAGTRPSWEDTDSDGLDDGEEVEVGTDPNHVDTDRDGLEDSWEVEEQSPTGTPLPGADPLAMDLYVEVNVGGGVTGLDDYSPVVEAFAEMPVENPDGSTGIRLHVEEGEKLEEEVVVTHSTVQEMEDKYPEALTRDRRDTHHSVFFADTGGYFIGWGDVGGRDVFVHGETSDYNKEWAMVHELLHNVVGEIDAEGRCPNDPNHYCEGGWLQTPHAGGNHYLPEPIADEIERDGFQSGYDPAF